MARVLVTRAVEDAGPLCEALRAAGHTPVCAPMIVRTRDREAVRQVLTGTPAPDVLLLTSPEAARMLLGALPPGFAPVRVATVGPATAHAAAEAGLSADVTQPTGTGAELVARLGPLQGLVVLHVRAARSVPATRAALDAAGAVVVDAVAYRTEAAPHRAAALSTAGPCDLVTLTAPSIVRAYVSAGADPGVGVITMGPTTTIAAQEHGLRVLAEACPHTVAGLVAAVPGRAQPS